MKIHISEPPWRARKCWDFRASTWARRSVLACVKHFAGYGAADGGRDYDSSYIPEELMWNVYLVPFKAAIDAGVGSVMSAYMDLNDVPASGNRWLLHDVLRDGWDFNGFVVSDAVAVRSLVTHGYASDVQDAAYKAFTAGLDHGHGEWHLPEVPARRSGAGADLDKADRRCGAAHPRSQNPHGTVRAPLL